VSARADDRATAGIINYISIGPSCNCRADGCADGAAGSQAGQFDIL